MRRLPISWAASRFDSEMRFREVEWSVIRAQLSKAKVGSETYAEYLKWDKETQLSAKDVGYYIIGEYRNNLRHNRDFVRRATVTLDIDTISADFESRLASAFESLEYFWHTSRKSCPAKPRIRIHFPLSRDIYSADEHEAVTRWVAAEIGIDIVDRVSFVPAQMMFFPSRSSDGVFAYGSHGGEWLNVDDVLSSRYINWHDRSEWPRGKDEIPPEIRTEKVDSPLHKPGIIGAFCRTYSITEVLETVIPGIYEPADDSGARWRYHAAEGGGGAIVYDDDTILYSHHTNHDPAAGHAQNAFDLVRIHKFGSEDLLCGKDTPATKRPSYLAMQSWVMTLPEVVQELSVAKNFAELDQADDFGAQEAAAEPWRDVDEAPPWQDDELPPAAAGPAVEAAGTADLTSDAELDTPAASQADAARARVRALLQDAFDGDTLLDTALPALAGAALGDAGEAALLGEIGARFRELEGRPIDARSLKRTLAEFAAKIRPGKGLRKVDGVPVEVDLLRNDEGKPLHTVDNICTWLASPLSGVSVKYDEFSDAVMVAPRGTAQWSEADESRIIRIRRQMERDGFTSLGSRNSLLEMAMGSAGQEQVFDSAKVWLGQQLWDGHKRVDTFLTRYFGALDSEYVRGVSRYIWTALAGRVMKPGEKADMMPILFGGQGVKKTTAVLAMAPFKEFAGEFAFKGSDADMCRMLRGKLVMEFSELRGMNSSNEEALRSFMSRTFDEHVPKWRERSTRRHRRLLFLGTTNDREMLSDPTGNRRYLPVSVYRADAAGIRADIDQLWAEGAEMFAKGGVAFQVETLARQAHEAHMISDLWDDLVLTWLESAVLSEEVGEETGLLNGDREFTLSEVLTAINVPVGRSGRAEEMRLARILSRYGYEKDAGWDQSGKKVRRFWKRKAKG